ncbi:PHD finger protein 7-like [Athene cunicularia]|uniref:PHD finger protein 7-like n=1 Tax=Athene cunicularia TaxID=194338 RepID=UPI000EF6CCBD|nr:PHD finger protein 7-like [Athene cunicularia]
MCTMSGRKREAPDSMEQACVLCGRAAADPDICGHKIQQHGLCAHVFCLFFANKLSQQPLEDVGLMGFLPEDIRRTIERAAQQQCFVCGKSGAATTCCREGCDRSFHLPCTTEGGCVTQFFFQYRSFCGEHSPEQAVEAAPEKDTTCLLCLELVGDRQSYGTMVCPACKHAWFHRGCIQGQAVRDGISCFRCPLCRDRDAFSSEMLSMGIRIPFSLPSQDPHAYDDLSERHSRCDACECLCPGGREQAEGLVPWHPSLLSASSSRSSITPRHRKAERNLSKPGEEETPSNRILRLGRRLVEEDGQGHWEASSPSQQCQPASIAEGLLGVTGFSLGPELNLAPRFSNTGLCIPFFLL